MLSGAGAEVIQHIILPISGSGISFLYFSIAILEEPLGTVSWLLSMFIGNANGIPIPILTLEIPWQVLLLINLRSLWTKIIFTNCSWFVTFSYYSFLIINFYW